MTKQSQPANANLWARFRFSVVGSLLSSPPAPGALRAAIRDLAARTWTHPVHARDVRFAPVTIERWYYKARRERDDPILVLRRSVRKDRGKVTLGASIAERLIAQYRVHRDWSYQLHYDNLTALVQADAKLGTVPSYSTVLRYMKAHGLTRLPRPRTKGRPGEHVAASPREQREVRSYETEYVGSLWHLDFHRASLKVLTESGQWQHPIALGILDDHSRLCCHVQWYLSETAADLVHGLSQAIQKRGLPRALLTDNGSAMLAEEVTEGLERLSVLHDFTLPYSPHQNGKQERFWATLEGRLMRMLDGQAQLMLEFLNQVTQAWAEIEYNRAWHDEIQCAPVERVAQSRDVLRASPSSEALRQAFRVAVKRRQRRSDGTITLDGVRFEVPARYRHFRDVTVHYARWDLGRVHLVDERTAAILAPIYPLDRSANADARRSIIPGDQNDSPPWEEPPDESTQSECELPPLLKKILAEYSATGLPPAYLPKRTDPNPGEPS
jgi:transposase InsO family protein